MLAALVLFAVASPARGQTPLQWKFKEGDKFSLEETLTSKMTTTAGGQKYAVDQTQSRVSSFVVKKVTGGTFEMEQKIESWKIQGASSLPLEEGTKLMEECARDVVFTFQLKPTGEIAMFKGYEQFEKNLAARDKDEAKKFEAIGGKEVFQSMLAFGFDFLPAKSAKSWTKEYVVPMGPLGEYKYALTCTDAGKGEIALKGTVSFMAPKSDSPAAAFKVLKMELTKNDITGKIVFDSAKGRLVSSEWTAPRTGTVTIERQGEMVNLSVEGTDSRTVRVLEK
jgi:hypothetical protein